MAPETCVGPAQQDDGVKSKGVAKTQVIDFATLGMFIIDDIEYLPPRPPQKDILGGAGSYAALGARLFSPAPTLSKRIGWVVDQGSDFPSAVATLVDSWDTSALLRHDPNRLTTRGWNGYVDDNETRAFKYLTPKKRLVAADLSGTPLLHAKAFHIICSPSRCRELVTELLTLRKEEAPPENDDDVEDSDGEGARGRGGYMRPIIIWEPVPDLCSPEELLNLTNCLPLVDVCSPNHSELAAFMSDTGLDPETGEISTAAVERSCEQLLGSMPLSSFTLVIRAGEKGCYIAKNGGRQKTTSSSAELNKKTAGGAGMSKGVKRRRKEIIGHHGGLQPDTDMMSLFAGLLQQANPSPTSADNDQKESHDDGSEEDGGKSKREEEEHEKIYTFIRDEDNEVVIDPGLDKWIPAYWTKADAATQVVDPTGGGNTFLGGLGVALARGESMEEAACWASVAASFAIQQVGVPILSRADKRKNGNDEEDKDVVKETWNGVEVGKRLAELHERMARAEAKG
ncbi:Ribokinase-like protein [Coniella lustricola]|uniref:Ribokinase-like protein n=1 Tax=Coniella lustricola TaxID=2025994 RepID=A0A2T3ANS5_9PEZI|nr:Ribokinase-like protein [Coniella lustricola]